jgi:hypothetical protein
LLLRWNLGRRETDELRSRGTPVRHLYARTTVRSERTPGHCLTLRHPINSIFGLHSSWFSPEVALNWLFPYPLITPVRRTCSGWRSCTAHPLVDGGQHRVRVRVRVMGSTAPVYLLRVAQLHRVFHPLVDVRQHRRQRLAAARTTPLPGTVGCRRHHLPQNRWVLACAAC